MFYWKDKYNYKKMEKKKKKSNVHISGFSSVIFSQHTYNRSCSPDTDTEDNQEPCDAMFLRSIYHSYPIDPAANMPEPRLPGHNGPRHPEILQVLGCPTGQGRYRFTELCISRWKTWTHLKKLMDTITLAKGYFSDPRKNLKHEPTEKTTVNYSIKQNRREPPQREHKCMYFGCLSLQRLHFTMAVLHLQIYVASRNKSL